MFSYYLVIFLAFVIGFIAPHIITKSVNKDTMLTAIIAGLIYVFIVYVVKV